MKRITFSKPNGDWGIEGVDLAELPPKLYAAAMKLKRYEDSGLSPDQVRDIIGYNNCNDCEHGYLMNGILKSVKAGGVSEQ